MRMRSRFAIVAALCVTILALATPASAGGKHGRGKHRGHHGHHERHYDRHEHRHHRGCGHDHYGYGYAPRHAGYAYPVYRHGGYYCGPCSGHFSSYDHLAHHVHLHHHVAAIALPSVIFQASIGGGVGWVFGDY
jgi:Ni/Co efflux regulator RcnB